MPEDRPIDGVDQTDLLLRHQRRREPLDRLAEDEEPGLREALDQAGFFWLRVVPSITYRSDDTGGSYLRLVRLALPC